MDDGKDSTNLRFGCACGEIRGSATVPTSTLPLPFDLCHCNICRHQTGLLCASYLTLPDDCTNIEFHGPLVNYKSSKTVTRSFCRTCGANIYVQDSSQSKPDICTGVLDKADGIIQLRSHIFVPDTKDGGLSVWLPNVAAWEGYAEQSARSKENMRSQEKSDTGTTRNVRTQAHCHCRGVQFMITRPCPESGELSAPYSDLLVEDTASKTNKEDTKWWLRADNSKYFAGTCACTSCRLNSGFDIQMWSFIPQVNLLQLNEEAMDFGMGTLKKYDSSPGVQRMFCSNCGATVFWTSHARPGLIDVSVGLLNALEGARAESWLEWWCDRVSFREEAQNTELFSKLSTGLQLWSATKDTQT